MATVIVSYSPSAFDRFKDRFLKAAQEMRADIRVTMRKFCLDWADELARCSQAQIDLLSSASSECMETNLMLKAREVGLGRMSRHVYNNESISFQAWMSLPQADKDALNDENRIHLVKHRNAAVPVKSKDLTPRQTRKIISSNRSRANNEGILSPDEQNEPRPLPPGQPKYMSIEDYEVDETNRQVIVVLRLNKATCKARLSFEMLEKIFADIHAPAAP